MFRSEACVPCCGLDPLLKESGQLQPCAPLTPHPAASAFHHHYRKLSAPQAPQPPAVPPPQPAAPPPSEHAQSPASSATAPAPLIAAPLGVERAAVVLLCADPFLDGRAGGTRGPLSLSAAFLSPLWARSAPLPRRCVRRGWGAASAVLGTARRGGGRDCGGTGGGPRREEKLRAGRPALETVCPPLPRRPEQPFRGAAAFPPLGAPPEGSSGRRDRAEKRTLCALASVLCLGFGVLGCYSFPFRLRVSCFLPSQHPCLCLCQGVGRSYRLLFGSGGGTDVLCLCGQVSPSSGLKWRQHLPEFSS